MNLSQAQEWWLRELRRKKTPRDVLDAYSAAVDRFRDYMQENQRPKDPAEATRGDVRSLLTEHFEDRSWLVMHLPEARDAWLRALAAEGEPRSTRDGCSSAVGSFVDYVQKHMPPTNVAEVTRGEFVREDFRGLMSRVQSTRLLASPPNRFTGVLQGLRAIFAWSGRSGTDTDVS
jgi:hypothetical protein